MPLVMKQLPSTILSRANKDSDNKKNNKAFDKLNVGLNTVKHWVLLYSDPNRLHKSGHELWTRGHTISIDIDQSFAS